MAEGGTERRPFVGHVDYKFTAQPAKLRTDVTGRLGQTEVDVSPTLEWPMPAASAATYQLYPGGPDYTMRSFNSTYGSSPQYLTVAADPAANPAVCYDLLPAAR